MFQKEINNQAPAVANATIYINADIKKVMRALKDIANWPTWRSDIDYTKVNFQNDKTIFKWKSGGLKYKSKIHTSTNTCFGWTGKTFGAYAIHNWSMNDEGNKTKVFVSESLSGFAIILMRKKMNKELPKLLEKDLAELKRFCEQK